jgi:hypothetical protein
MDERFIFRAFRAPDDIDACIRYKEGHQAVLRDYGITNITSNNDEWMQDPNMYCVMALTMDESIMIGGIRVQVSEEGKLLPVEKAIGKMDHRIHKIVDNYRIDGGVGELSALWNAKTVAGLGVSMLLVRAGISITNQAGINTLIGICGEYTLKMFQQVGFVVDHSLGLNGLFAYPKDEYQARVLGILNSSTLDTAEKYDKDRIQAIRENPVATFMEHGTKSEIEINYQLVVADYNEKKKYA